MPTKVNSDVESVNIDRIVQAVNDNYYKILDVEQKVRWLESRIDNIVPTTVHMKVVPPSRVLFGAAIAGTAVAIGYLTYVEIRRNSNNSNKQQ